MAIFCPKCRHKTMVSMTSESNGPKKCLSCGSVWKAIYLSLFQFRQMTQEAQKIDKDLVNDVENDYERKSYEARKFLLEK